MSLLKPDMFKESMKMPLQRLKMKIILGFMFSLILLLVETTDGLHLEALEYITLSL